MRSEISIFDRLIHLNKLQVASLFRGRWWSRIDFKALVLHMNKPGSSGLVAPTVLTGLESDLILEVQSPNCDVEPVELSIAHC